MRVTGIDTRMQTNHAPRPGRPGARRIIFAVGVILLEDAADVEPTTPTPGACLPISARCLLGECTERSIPLPPVAKAA